MGAPERFEIVNDVAKYRPVGQVSFKQAVELAVNAMAACNEAGAKKLLINATGLTGFSAPSTVERYAFGERVAKVRGVTVALVVHGYMIDSERFGVVVARNRGANVDVFTTEADALKWLDAQTT